MRKSIIILILASIVTALPARANSPMPIPPLQVVLLTIPGVTLSDLLSADPNGSISRIMRDGAIGLMNSRTAGRVIIPDEEKGIDLKYAPEAGYLTIGAGARAIAGLEARDAFNTNAMLEGASAGDVFRRRTLVDPGGAEVVHAEIARLKRDNSLFNYQITIGALGKTLRSAGIKTAAFGNSDDATRHREIAAIAMDDNGLVDYGQVDEPHDAPAASDYLLRTDPNALIRSVRRVISKDSSPSFIAVEFGDLGRLERAMPDMMDAAYARRKSETLNRADRFIGRLMKSIGESGILIILSPYPSYGLLEKTGNNLCPVLAIGYGIESGLLTSGSTRTPGVITNLDIAPTILGWFAIPSPADFAGRQLSVAPSTSPINTLSAIDGRASVQATNMPVLRQAAGVMIAIALIALLVWCAMRREAARRRRIVEAIALIPPSMMPALLLTGLLPVSGALLAWGFIGAVTFGIWVILRLASRDTAWSLMLASLIFVVLAAVDIATGGYLCSQSILGYSVVEGSRYYGMGNEVMGALTGAMLAGIGLLSGYRKWTLKTIRIALALGLISGAALIGSSSLGANTGGAISIVTAFGVALAMTSERKPAPTSLIPVALGVAAVLGALIALDVMRGQSGESHLGKAFGALASGGYEQIGLLIKRKLAMNIILIKGSIWSKLLAVYLASIAILIRSGDVTPILRRNQAGYRIALAGIIAGATAAFVFNDSGVVAAGTCIIYAWSLILIMSAQEKHEIANL